MNTWQLAGNRQRFGNVEPATGNRQTGTPRGISAAAATGNQPATNRQPAPGRRPAHEARGRVYLGACRRDPASAQMIGAGA